MIRHTIALLLLPACLAAQMTVEGQVTNAVGVPVQGASVGIASLGVNTRTNAEGRYNFLIRAAQIRGQLVAMVAQHGRFGTQTVQVQLTGGSLVQNFVLTTGERPRVPDVTRPNAPRTDTIPPRTPSAPRDRSVVALSAPAASLFDASPGPTDFVSALAGKHPALNVTSASGPGASATIMFRGPRSLAGNIQPLVVVDGVPVDNQPFTTNSQRFGLGGFDYGSPLNDISPDDIASYELLDQATASLLYGSRAANGVLRLTTKSGREITGFRIAATSRFTAQSPQRLPSYQNAFGQGLGGQYEFFDGQGGGINDAVAESWGPKLDGSPVAQHSLTEPRRPDVRYWLPRADGVRDYFQGGGTLDASVAFLGSRDASNMRAAVNVRNVTGLSPNESARRLGLTLGGASQFTSRISADANLQIIGSRAEHRPGTGFDEINPVAGFTRIGRQLDFDALRDSVRNQAGEAISWIYTNRNNPFFATSENSNDDRRTHVIGGVGLTFGLANWLSARLHAGTDDFSETRNVAIAKGWLGGYPGTLGRGDFSGGGSDKHSVKASERLVDISFVTAASRLAGLDLTTTAGASSRANTFESNARTVDLPTTGPAVVDTLSLSGKNNIASFYALGSASRSDYLTLTAGARQEQASSLPQSSSAVFPSFSATFDVARRVSVLREVLHLGVAQVRASWWRAGNEVTSRTLAQMYFEGGAPSAADSNVSGPERTAGVELGAHLVSTNARVGLDFTAYRERSTELQLATPVGGGLSRLSQNGQVFNGGFSAVLRFGVLQSEKITWDIAGGYARNTSTVDALGDGAIQAKLSPSLFGAGLGAQIGGPAGLIVGSRYLRDATGSLLLRNGLPVADATSPFTVFGSWQPDWTGNMQSKLRYAGMELFVLLDVRMGGKLFSATNMWGSYAGTLESTLIGERAQPGTQRVLEDSLTIAGTDSLLGTPNTTKVSAEQYFHSLGAITEPWVYDASYAKLREARLSYEVPTRFLPGFREHTLRVSLIGRNLMTWAKAPNVDPETTLAGGAFQGFEMGQLPAVRSLGLQLSVTP